MASKEIRQLIERFEQEFTGTFNPERLDEWMPIIRSYLAREYLTDTQIYDQVKRLLNTRYRVLTKQVKKRHKITAKRFGPEIIREEYRPMLAARIKASADLIKLNRDEQIERQLRRFAGWASGGLPNQKQRDDRGELARELNKSLHSLSFERRRVCIDQGHKLMAAIDDVIAEQYGAIAKKWRHIIPHGDYQSRPKHLERNGKVFAVKGNAKLKAGEMKKGGRPYAEDLDEQPAMAPYCSCWWESIYDVSDLPPDMRATK